MKRQNCIRISDRVEKAVSFAQLVDYAETGKKLTKAAMIEKLLDLGITLWGKQMKLEIPDDLKPGS